MRRPRREVNVSGFELRHGCYSKTAMITRLCAPKDLYAVHSFELPAGGFTFRIGCFIDEFGNRLRVRDVDRMASGK
jgi:hypothetical protein